MYCNSALVFGIRVTVENDNKDKHVKREVLLPIVDDFVGRIDIEFMPM